MGYKAEVFLLLVLFSNRLFGLCGVEDATGPRVAVVVVSRDRGHALPYFLSTFELQSYPKKLIDLCIISEDHTRLSGDVVHQWSHRNRPNYRSIHSITNIKLLPDNETEDERLAWVKELNRHIADLREQGLDFAREVSADFVFMLDPDAFLMEPDTIKIFVERNYSVAAPMLESHNMHSNFWIRLSGDYTEEDEKKHRWLVARERKFQGCSDLAALDSAVMFSLRRAHSEKLTYLPEKLHKKQKYEGEVKDVLVFTESARRLGYKMKLCNDQFFGFVVDKSLEHDLDKNQQALIDLKVDVLRRGSELPLNDNLKHFVSYPKTSTLYCDKIYMINLERRPERKKLMMKTFKELGMAVKRVPAIDGIVLNHSTMKGLNLHLLKNFEDPYHKRPMKSGEIGCFLSHYIVWKKIVRNRYNHAMVLEDDVHFTPNFRDNFMDLMMELRGVDFDLLYLGRKVMMEAQEEAVTAHTTRPLYSYWTVGYVLTYRGAQKLLDAQPLQKMMPVDEFIPIMFNQHPNWTWKSFYPKRDLVALSASPLLVYPTHYVGMPGYVSDTELSYVVDLRNQRARPAPAAPRPRGHDYDF